MKSTSSGRKRRPSPPSDGDTSLPIGTVTFLMTDVEGSTRAWNASPQAAKQALGRHDEIVVAQVQQNHGHIVESGREGDSILAVFPQATDAVAAAVEIQRLLQRERWPAGAELRVRVAVHTGQADLKSGHYVGAPLYRCARLMATGHGGQVLISAATAELVADALPSGVSLRDLGLHRLRDLSRAEHVYQLLHADLAADFPPLKSMEPERSNLPEHLTSFVGRDAELSALRKLIQESRLVTVLGPGGIGKSRLAVQLARSLTKSGHEVWPDGVWWTELTGADDAADALLTTLELPGRGVALDVVSSWLATKRALLLLDNCEHIVVACARACQALLERSSNLTILATSREPLGLNGEVRWQLAALGEGDALRLFEARAKLVRPDQDAPQERETVYEICRQLDRLPLAIEMAASRLDVMSERELLANLNDRFRVLATRARTGPERQQTMVATIDWSHRLLTQQEAQLFRRLAVFQGGFTYEAAQAVCSEPGGVDLLSALTGLVQKSMLVAERFGDGTRYRLLESHHPYAAGKLRDAGELDTMSRRHYDYYKTWLQRPIETKTKARESANLWASLAWARERTPDMGLELAIEVAAFEYTDHGRARALLLDLLERSSAEGATRARALNLAARLSSRQADHRQGRVLAESSVAAAREIGDPLLIAQTLSGAGLVYHAANELVTARGMYEEALSLLTGSENQGLAIEVQNQLAVLSAEQGRLDDALKILAGCLAYSRSHGDESRTGRYLESRANVELGLGAIEDASADWHEALAIHRELGDPFGTIWCLGGLALVAAARDDHERALRLGSVTDRMSREWSLSAWPVRVKQLEETYARARQRLGARKAEEIWNQGQSMTAEHALDYALADDVAAVPEQAGPLSRREREVAAMVAAGMTNKHIAERLFIAERTAEGHVERIRNKLGVRSRTEVATWAVEHGLAGARSGKH
jgi:predicted ATPase/class 3 adenylate cyclase/DNA-binding CsgD family transcriptional regulator